MRIADDRIRILDRTLVAHAARLVVRIESAEVGGALGAAPALALYREALGGEELRLAFDLLCRARGAVRPGEAQPIALERGRFCVADDDAIERLRRRDRDVAVRHVRLDARRIALERIAEAAGRRPQHRVYV